MVAVQAFSDSDEVGAGLSTVSSSQPVSESPMTPSVAPSSVAPSAVESPDVAPDTSEAARAALAGCQAKVRAADKTIDAMKRGIGNWDDHVQAQTDANNGKITGEKQNKIFARTRLAGPDDVSRYSSATSAHDKLDGSCAEVSDAPDNVATSLAQCQTRADAQKPVLAAGKAGMGDWTSHLSAMKKSRNEDVPDARKIWVKASKAAPKNINAWESSLKRYNPPKC